MLFDMSLLCKVIIGLPSRLGIDADDDADADADDDAVADADILLC